MKLLCSQLWMTEVRMGLPMQASVQTLIATALCLGSAGCRPQAPEKDRASFHIVATDAAFEAPAKVPAGLRHILFENRGAEIHESMLVKLEPGMSPEGYVAQVKAGHLFPTGGRDYSGPGLTSPGESDRTLDQARSRQLHSHLLER